MPANEPRYLDEDSVNENAMITKLVQEMADALLKTVLNGGKPAVVSMLILGAIKNSYEVADEMIKNVPAIAQEFENVNKAIRGLIVLRFMRNLAGEAQARYGINEE